MWMSCFEAPETGDWIKLPTLALVTIPTIYQTTPAAAVTWPGKVEL